MCFLGSYFLNRHPNDEAPDAIVIICIALVSFSDAGIPKEFPSFTRSSWSLVLKPGNEVHPSGGSLPLSVCLSDVVFAFIFIMSCLSQVRIYLTFDPSWQFNFCSLLLSSSSSLSGATAS